MLYNKICVMLPTRGRSKTRLPVFLGSMIDTADSVENLCVSFVVNVDDNETEDYIKRFCDGKVDYEIIHEDTETCNLPRYFNLSYYKTRFNEHDTCVSMFGDDMVFVTPGWDRIALDKINDKMGFGIVYGDDDWCQHQNMCVYFVTTRRYIELIGVPFMCEEFPVDYVDKIHYEAAKQLGALWYIPKLHIRHDHSKKINDIDETTRRNREMVGCANSKSGVDKNVVDQMVANVRKKLSEIDLSELSFVMTTYDRPRVFEQTVMSWNRSVWNPPLTIFDDGSTQWDKMESLIKRMSGDVSFTHGLHNRGCDGNHRLTFEWILSKNKAAKAIVVLDSDTIFSEVWLFGVLQLWELVKLDFTCCGGSIFNAPQHESFDEEDEEFIWKNSIGGLGALYRRELVELFLKSSPNGCKDMVINDIANKAGWRFLCTRQSFVQHGGCLEGLHVSDQYKADHAENFTGETTPKREAVQCQTNGRVLFAAMARLGDVIAASMIANMLVERGLRLTWLTIPRYAGLVGRICPAAKVITFEPLVGGPDGEWSETFIAKMKENYLNFDVYINAQIGSRENHDEYMRSGMTPCEYMAMLCNETLGIELGTNYRDYLKFNDKGIHCETDREKLPENLAIICPQAQTSQAITDLMVKEIFADLQKKGYSPRILIPKVADSVTARELRERYIHKQTVEQCICIIRKAKYFVGNDSGMAWCSLYSECSKKIYHKKLRIQKVNTWFSKIDSKAEDIVLEGL